MLHGALNCFIVLADDPKNDAYSENDGWEFVSLGDQVNQAFAKYVSYIYFSCILDVWKKLDMIAMEYDVQI